MVLLQFFIGVSREDGLDFGGSLLAAASLLIDENYVLGCLNCIVTSFRVLWYLKRVRVVGRVHRILFLDLRTVLADREPLNRIPILAGLQIHRIVRLLPIEYCFVVLRIGIVGVNYPGFEFLHTRTQTNLVQHVASPIRIKIRSDFLIVGVLVAATLSAGLLL